MLYGWGVHRLSFGSCVVLSFPQLFIFHSRFLQSLSLLGGLPLSLQVMVMISIDSQIAEVEGNRHRLEQPYIMRIHSMKLNERCELFGS